jgi:hypothetical protein
MNHLPLTAHHLAQTQHAVAQGLGQCLLFYLCRNCVNPCVWHVSPIKTRFRISFGRGLVAACMRVIARERMGNQEKDLPNATDRDTPFKRLFFSSPWLLDACIA